MSGANKGMRAAWWWIDRWRKSTAYTDMTLAEQGAYRNLLDELWLRDGVLPDNERILGKIAGDAIAWPDVREEVMARFYRSPEGWRNRTHDEVAHQSQRRARNQRAYRERLRRDNAADNAADNVTGDVTSHNPASPSPSPSPSQKKRSAPAPSEPSLPRAGSGTTARGSERAGYPESFERFWAVYPKKVGKRDALKAWRTVKAANHVDAVVTAVETWKRSPDWNREDGQFIPYPATWLRRGGWDDEVPESRWNGEAPF